MIRRVLGGLSITLLILSAQLIAIVSFSTTEGSDVLVFRKIAFVDVDTKGEPVLLNLTDVYMRFNLTSQHNTTISCNTSCNASQCGGSSIDLSIDLLANITDENRSLVFVGIKSSNGTWSYTMYTLAYKAREEEYNLTVVTRIYTNENNTNEYSLFLTIANIQPVPEKAEPIMDAILVVNSTKLSSHYKVLAESLKRYLGDNETKWLWNKVSIELDKLSKMVNKHLEIYDKPAKGMAVVMDFGWLTCAIACITCGAAIGAVIGCAIATMGAGFIACLATIFGVSSSAVLGALLTATGVIFLCVQCCCCAGYATCCDVL
ncbi:MAG TPA: hypothetical protein VNL13_00070 [Sulfolobales archaeon]|nr:hypothetical protein [Sulfolobales archaeon]